METAKIEFATSRTPRKVDAKRALYQLSYVPFAKVRLLNNIHRDSLTPPLIPNIFLTASTTNIPVWPGVMLKCEEDVWDEGWGANPSSLTHLKQYPS